MARPRKRRRVCGMPKYITFGPINRLDENNEVITLTVDEYEVIRLIDLEGFEQEQCAEKMGVARSTVQRMYVAAKQKLADCLVNGKVLKIEGGDFVVSNINCGKCSFCRGGRHRHGRKSNWTTLM